MQTYAESSFGALSNGRGVLDRKLFPLSEEQCFRMRGRHRGESATNVEHIVNRCRVGNIGAGDGGKFHAESCPPRRRANAVANEIPSSNEQPREINSAGVIASPPGDKERLCRHVRGRVDTDSPRCEREHLSVTQRVQLDKPLLVAHGPTLNAHNHSMSGQESPVTGQPRVTAFKWAHSPQITTPYRYRYPYQYRFTAL